MKRLLPLLLLVGLTACTAPGSGNGSSSSSAALASSASSAAFCGGIGGIACPSGQLCVDDPSDSCDPTAGGADCGGMCVLPNDPTSMIHVTQPLVNAAITSPLTVTGEARGNWYFEASFPVKLLDDTGNEIAVIPAQAQGEWMTTDFVPFTATLSFSTTAKTGTLVLEKDNPSGLPQNDASLRIPVRFSPADVGQ